MRPLGPRTVALQAWASVRPCLRPLTTGDTGRRHGLLTASTGFVAAAGCAALAHSGRLPLGSIVAASSASRGRSGQQGGGELGHANRRATDALLVANVLLYGLQVLTKQGLTVWGAKVNALMLAGQWWRLLTPAFLHGNLMHLVVNSYSLNNLGPLVETTAGRPRYLLMYLAAAVAGNLASFVGSPKAISLGASGAIFGIGGALAMHFYCNRELYGKRSDMVLRSLWQTLLINIIYGAANPRIDNWGHLGGLVGGALAALLLGPRWQQTTLPGRKGKWLIDKAPLPWFRAGPRQISQR